MFYYHVINTQDMTVNFHSDLLGIRVINMNLYESQYVQLRVLY